MEACLPVLDCVQTRDTPVARQELAAQRGQCPPMRAARARGSTAAHHLAQSFEPNEVCTSNFEFTNLSHAKEAKPMDVVFSGVLPLKTEF